MPKSPLGGVPMSMDWKETIRQWFQLQNRCMVNGPIEEIASFFDNSYLAHKEIERWIRVQEQQRDRGIHQGKCETKVKLKSVEQQGKDKLIKLQTHSSFVYQLKGELTKEERFEQREVRLRNKSGYWKVVGDDQGKEGKGFEQQDLPLWIDRKTAYQPDLRIASIPLMNEKMLRHASGARERRYDRNKAARYADAWWNSYNSEYRQFSVDCTNYVSQSLFAGGAPMSNIGRRDRGWWYKHAGGQGDQWSYSWSVAHSLRWFLPNSKSGLRAEEVSSAKELKMGDIICYDFDGDGKWQHNTIVTDHDAMGEPLVNAHTTNSYHRYWDYRDSYAYSEKIKYKFFHIADEF
jgi:hypothetical protein